MNSFLCVRNDHCCLCDRWSSYQESHCLHCHQVGLFEEQVKKTAVCVAEIIDTSLIGDCCIIDEIATSFVSLSLVICLDAAQTQRGIEQRVPCSICGRARGVLPFKVRFENLLVDNWENVVDIDDKAF